ncbi:hypothetical protein C6W92_08135 [Roseovarius sp. A46]|mgnify:FL=1|jgi:uncharacterized membrane protein YphA (DoxX/SURF4 family)|uniref:hypothetical protein n=1 Tax=Roseovarius TaxID=74030 RepID=UPI000CE176EC|nr:MULTISPECIES: hypothetical protein [Roseovarius]RXV64033.1 hypothetical protein C6W92_08135 [Roseovarius sp. A46]
MDATRLSPQDKLDGLALLILRLGLAWFIFLWAAHKIITPKQYQNLARHFDGVEVSVGQVMLGGWVQIALCALVALGVLRYLSYGSLLVMHVFTVTRRWEGFVDPFALNDRGFPVNRNQVIDLAVLGAFIALVLLIRRDHFSVGGWLARHDRPRWWL